MKLPSNTLRPVDLAILCVVDAAVDSAVDAAALDVHVGYRIKRLDLWKYRAFGM